MARLLHVRRDTVYTWKHRGVIPDPDWTISGRPVWARATIESWAKETGRWPRNGDGT